MGFPNIDERLSPFVNWLIARPLFDHTNSTASPQRAELQTCRSEIPFKHTKGVTISAMATVRFWHEADMMVIWPHVR
jgi:hypothetical protein